MTLKKSLIAGLVAVAALSLTANSTYAFFGHRGGSCGSWGGGSGGSWGGGSYGSGGSWGGGSRGSWGGGGSYGSGGSWGGGSYGSGGSYGGGSCGSSGGYTVISSGCDSCGGYSSSGVVYGGYSVSRPVTTTVIASSQPAVKTRLTLHVPADAKVTLAGVETKQTGEVREFATSKLAAGQNWSDYKVVIETTRDGKTLREERTLTLTGGQDQDLAVNFESDSNTQVAAK